MCSGAFVCRLGTSGKPTYMAGSWEGPSARGREEEGEQLDLIIQLVPCRGLEAGDNSDQWIGDNTYMSANIPCPALQRAVKADTSSAIFSLPFTTLSTEIF